MTITVSEILGKSESGSIDKNGTRSLLRKFHVYSDTGTLSITGALSATGLPDEPSGGNAGDTVTADGKEFYYWGTRDFTRSQGHDDQWVLSYEYSSSVVPFGDGIPDEKSGGVRATTRGTYRANADAPSSSDVLPKSDIGGTRIDSGGIKTSVTYPQATLSIKSYQTNEPEISDFTGIVGKRNQSAYQGGAIGTVLFVGVQFSKNTSIDKWVLDYEFAYDSRTFHADQVAKTGAQGEVVLDIDGIGENASATAKHVYWVQPFQKASFSNLP